MNSEVLIFNFCFINVICSFKQQASKHFTLCISSPEQQVNTGTNHGNAQFRGEWRYEGIKELMRRLMRWGINPKREFSKINKEKWVYGYSIIWPTGNTFKTHLTKSSDYIVWWTLFNLWYKNVIKCCAVCQPFHNSYSRENCSFMFKKFFFEIFVLWLSTWNSRIKIFYMIVKWLDTQHATCWVIPIKAHWWSAMFLSSSGNFSLGK